MNAKRAKLEKSYLFFLPGALALTIIVISLFVFLFVNALPAFYYAGKYVPEFLPAIYGTAIVTTVAVLLAIPLSIGLAIFIAELSPKAVRDVLINISDLMAAFPTVVYGLWGLTELGPFLKSTLFAFINRYLGFLPVFSGTPTGVSYLLASMVLAVMISPFASSLIREIYLQVPRSLDEGIYALGLGRWEVVRIKLGFIKRGIVGALTLAFGRAVGETVAVAMTVGGVVAINKSLLSPGITIPAYIANLFGEAFSTVDVASFFMLSLILLGIGTAFLAAARLFIVSEQREVRTYGKA